MRNHFEPSLKSNITLKYVVGKLHPDIIDDELEENITIENEVTPHFIQKFRGLKGTYKVRMSEGKNSSALFLEKTRPAMFSPALKFIKYHDVRLVDFHSMKLNDESCLMIAEYLEKNPSLRSLTLDKN